MPSRKRPAALWLTTFLLGFAVVCGLLLITLFTPPPYGDLTRLGRVSDTQFGWRRPPPQVPAELLLGSPIDQADILVIGDSFSMTHRWQSVLAKNGYRVATTFWGQYGDELCADFADWLQRGGFRGKLVILESVERLTADRVKKSAECKATPNRLEAKREVFLAPLEHLPAFQFNTGAPLTAGWVTYRNTRKVMETPGDVPTDYRTMAREVKDGCSYFSNRSCGKVLFFTEDDENGPLTPVHAQLMEDFNRAHPSVPIMWMIIPNKTTVYIDPANSADFVQAFGQKRLGPDLFAFAQRERGRIMDFYFPNDTHLSMHGQLALGEYMLGEVQKRVPAPGAKTP
ncbi:hypothetical protein [Xenophilus sp.]|uniref:hypothetical protein n=1 Tax=Xenophilus sp. TaxID=1873499 RepID=UPI0037DD11FA